VLGMNSFAVALRAFPVQDTNVKLNNYGICNIPSNNKKKKIHFG
jgi:hypothetical protein